MKVSVGIKIFDKDHCIVEEEFKGYFYKCIFVKIGKNYQPYDFVSIRTPNKTWYLLQDGRIPEGIREEVYKKAKEAYRKVQNIMN